MSNNFNLFKDVLEAEAEAILLANKKVKVDQIDQLESLFEGLIASRASLVFVGIGKSGQIGAKLASTFSSLGMSSYSLHPIEALHGDLGRVSENDVFVFISKSGNTEEILKLLPYLPINKNTIGLLGSVHSSIERNCFLSFDCSVNKEACINNQAPTTSSTLALAVGDAMAVVYEKVSGISKEGFAVNHPGGLLGKSLLMKVDSLMWKAEQCPVLSPDDSLEDAILLMTENNLGGCAVVKNNNFLGILVEGDIRRAFTKKFNLKTKLSELINREPVYIGPEKLAAQALSMMESPKRQISIMPVLSDKREFLGFIRIHDLLREGFSVK
jgi:arabinose-5-phosphate isomerase